MVSGVFNIHLTFATVYTKKALSPFERSERNYERYYRSEYPVSEKEIKPDSGFHLLIFNFQFIILD